MCPTSTSWATARGGSSWPPFEPGHLMIARTIIAPGNHDAHQVNESDVAAGRGFFAGAAPAAETCRWSMPRSRGTGKPCVPCWAVAKVDIAGADGMTALIWAAHRNDTETAALLLRAGADVKAPTVRRDGTLCGRGERRSGNRRNAAGGRRRCQRAPVVRRDAAHGGSRAGQPRNGARAAVPRRGPQRTGGKWRANRVDVDDLGTAFRGDRGIGAARRRRPRPFEQGIYRFDVRRPGRRCRFRARPHWRRREGERRHAENGADTLDHRRCHRAHRGRGAAARQRRQSRCRRRRRVHAFALRREEQGSGGNGERAAAARRKT